MTSGNDALDKKLLLLRRKSLLEKLAETDEKLQDISEREYRANVAEGHYQNEVQLWEAVAKPEQKDEPSQD